MHHDPTAQPLAKGLDPVASAGAFASTNRSLPSAPAAIVGAAVLTGTGQQLDNAAAALSRQA